MFEYIKTKIELPFLNEETKMYRIKMGGHC